MREGGNRVPATAKGPLIEAGSGNYYVLSGLLFMVTFAAIACVKLSKKDRERQTITFDSYDTSPVLSDTRKPARATQGAGLRFPAGGRE